MGDEIAYPLLLRHPREVMAGIHGDDVRGVGMCDKLPGARVARAAFDIYHVDAAGIYRKPDEPRVLPGVKAHISALLRRAEREQQRHIPKRFADAAQVVQQAGSVAHIRAPVGAVLHRVGVGAPHKRQRLQRAVDTGAHNRADELHAPAAKLQPAYIYVSDMSTLLTYGGIPGFSHAARRLSTRKMRGRGPRPSRAVSAGAL